MFEQKKVYQSMENRNYTPESLHRELDLLKRFSFDDVSYTGLHLNISMLVSQYLRDSDFKQIEVKGGLAKKSDELWQKDISLAIHIYNHFVDYTNDYFNYYLKEAKKFEVETGYSESSKEFKTYFEQGNSMYFHDVLHSVFDLSRKIDLSIDDFKEVLISEHKSLDAYKLPEKKVFTKDIK